MASMTAKKARFIRKAIEVAQEADALYARIDGLLADLFADEFNSGATNALADGDFTGDADYLTAAKLQAAMNALQAVQTAFDANGNLTAVRQAKYA